MTASKFFRSRANHPLTRALTAFQLAAHRHPRRVSAAVLVLLGGSAVTAFGVAPLAALPEATPPAVTQLTEPVTSPLLTVQIQALEDATLPLWRSDVTRHADTVDSLLKRLGVDDMVAAQFIRNDPVAGTLLQGRTGKSVKVEAHDGRLMRMVVRGPADTTSDFDTHFVRLTVERVSDAAGERFETRRELVPLQVTERMASGTIRSSLFAAADAAGIPDSVTTQIAEIFGTDIDFRRELRQGDAFSVLYESYLADDEPVTWTGSAGRVLAARFINQGKAHNAVWFQEAGRKGAYFDLTGRSKNRAFLASPLAFSRVTSGFAMRFHPIHKTWRAHLGVDYGAPTGTPPGGVLVEVGVHARVVQPFTASNAHAPLGLQALPVVPGRHAFGPQVDDVALGLGVVRSRAVKSACGGELGHQAAHGRGQVVLLDRVGLVLRALCTACLGMFSNAAGDLG